MHKRVTGSMVLALTLAVSACSAGKDEASKTAGAAADSADTLPAPETSESPAAKLLASFPKAFQGTWDMPGEYACDEYSDSVMHIGDKGVQYYEGYDIIKSITQVDADTLDIEATFEFTDERTEDNYRLSLKDGGKLLDFRSKDGKVTEFKRCDKAKPQASAAPKPAAASISIPQVFRGKWAFGDTSGCKAANFADLIVEEKYVTMGKSRSEIVAMTNHGDEALDLTSRGKDGRDEKFSLGLDNNGQSLAYGGEGFSGMTFHRCPK